MKQPTRFAILGAGSWGTALALQLSKNGHVVFLWDKDQQLIQTMKNTQQTPYLPGINLPPAFQYHESLEAAREAADLTLIAVPSHAFEAVLLNIKSQGLLNQPILWVTKGLSQKGAFLHSLVETELNTKNYAVLSGPSFAKEVALGLPTAVTIASKESSLALSLAQAFHHNAFSVFVSNDVLGLQLGGVYKNILAVCIGISDGLNFGANARAALITQGLAELRAFAVKLGAQPETIMGLSGCGDMILTATDDQSRNRRFGLALAQGLTEEQALKKIGQVVEAVYNIDQLSHLATEHGIELPILGQMFQILKHKLPAREGIAALFARKPTKEGDL